MRARDRCAGAGMTGSTLKHMRLAGIQYNTVSVLVADQGGSIAIQYPARWRSEVLPFERVSSPSSVLSS